MYVRERGYARTLTHIRMYTHHRRHPQGKGTGGAGKSGAQGGPAPLLAGGEGQLIIELFLFHVALPVLLERFRCVRVGDCASVMCVRGHAVCASIHPFTHPPPPKTKKK